MIRKNRDITCCFTGHRAEKLPWGHNEKDGACLLLKRAIADTLAAVYGAGFRHFLCGMATGADMYFGEAAVALRDEHPEVTLEAAVPYQGQEKRWSGELRARYYRLAEECDAVTVLRRTHAPGCMMARNRYMIDRSCLLIAAYDGRPGGTRNTQEYAQAQGLTIIQIPVTGLPGGDGGG